MYIADLELCNYHSGAFEAGNWLVPLRAVGWLEHPPAFSTGSSPSAVISKLKTMVEQVRSEYPHYLFRGVHSCSICLASEMPSPGPIWSQENIFVPGREVVYVSPGGIVHYMEAHSYLPPPEFVEAVLQCPDLRTTQYREALRAANGGIEPPLEVDIRPAARRSRLPSV